MTISKLVCYYPQMTQTILAVIATLLAVYLTVSTVDYRYEIERENESLKSQVRGLKAQVADPPRLCREYFREKMRGNKYRSKLKGTK